MLSGCAETRCFPQDIRQLQAARLAKSGVSVGIFESFFPWGGREAIRESGGSVYIIPVPVVRGNFF